MNTIGNMQNEKNFFYHCNEFEYNHDFEKLTMHFWYTKFYEKDYYKFLFFE